MINIPPWVELELAQVRHWLEQRIDRQFCRDISTAARNLLPDRACVGCGYVKCSCPPEEPAKETGPKVVAELDGWKWLEGAKNQWGLVDPHGKTRHGVRRYPEASSLRWHDLTTNKTRSCCWQAAKLVEIGHLGHRLAHALSDAVDPVDYEDAAPTERWAPDVYPCGPWEIDPKDELPRRMSLDGEDEGAYVLRLPESFEWFVVMKRPYDAERPWRGEADTIEEAKAAADARLAPEEV